jgi:hypothetical protein
MRRSPEQQRGADPSATGVRGRAGRARGRLVRSVRLAFIVSLLAVVAFVAGSLRGAWAAGEPAPDITLRTENGDFRVADQKGKVVVLYFSFPG